MVNNSALADTMEVFNKIRDSVVKSDVAATLTQAYQIAALRAEVVDLTKELRAQRAAIDA